MVNFDGQGGYAYFLKCAWGARQGHLSIAASVGEEVRGGGM